MKEKSNIQWTDYTWNIARGCTKVDEDCKFCYMYRESFDGSRYDPMAVVRTKTVFNLPLKIKEPSKIFTCSLTDFFHEGCDSFRDEAWDIIRKCPQHTFQILTKRPERINDCLPSFWGEIKSRCWMGTSVGGNSGVDRLYELAESNTATTFVSFEPLHEDLDLPADGLLDYFDWIIIGGESGNETGKYRYRPCKLEWIEYIIKRFREESKAKIFVKQLGTYLAKEMKMTDRHGGNIEEFPEHLRIREFPTSHEINSVSLTERIK